jgi:toxoflavin biosynthesis protein ToxC
MKHVGPISGVAAYPGRWVATAGYDNQVILWDAASGAAVARGYHDHLANQCAFDASGRLLVTASSDYTARVWNVPELRLVAVLADHRDDVEMAAFDPSGRRIATCSRDHDVRIYSVNGTLLRVLSGHQADVISVTWSRDGSYLITSRDDGSVRRWSAESGIQEGLIDLQGIETDTVVIGPDGTIFSGDDTGTITIVRDATALRVPAHEAGIKRLLLDIDGGRLASLSYDRRMIIWRVGGRGLERLSETAMPAVVWPRSAAFLDETRLAFATFGSTYAVFDIATGLWDASRVEPDQSINAVAILDGTTYTIGDAGRLRRNGVVVSELGSLCNFLLPFAGTLLAGGQMGIIFDGLCGTIVHQHRPPLNCGAAFVSDGTPHAIIGTYTGEGLVLRQGPDGRLTFVAAIPLHENAVKGISVSGDRIFSVCATGSAAWHHADDFRLMARIGRAHDRIANGCVGLPNGRFASISRDRKLRIWREDAPDVFETPHANSIKGVNASPDGRWIATGSYAGSVAVLDTRAQRWCHTARPTAAGISCIVPTGRGGEFLASSYDGCTYPVCAG